ncbi:MAG: hypothetical protein RLZZ420_1234, partial [Bacteroidota bacterium]
PELANFGNKKNAESLVGSAFQRFVFVARRGIITNYLVQDLASTIEFNSTACIH